MARQLWNIFTWNGSSWDADGTVYRTNRDLELSRTSNQTKMKLADGTEGRVTPETKFVRDSTTFTWLALDFSDGLKTKVQGYITNHTKIKITTQKSEDIIGYFLYIRRVWLSGVEDTEDLEAGFDRSE